MRRRTRVVLSLLSLATALLAGAAAADEKGGPAGNPGVEKLVRQLADDDWRARRRAYRALEDMGEAAGPALARAVKESPSLEIQLRARLLLRYIRIIPPEDSDRMSALIEEFFRVSDPKRRGVIRKMRAVDNAPFWLMRKMAGKKGLDLKRWAVLTYWFQYGRPMEWRDRKAPLAERVLVTILRDRFSLPVVRHEALKILGKVGSIRSAVTMAQVASGNQEYYNYEPEDTDRMQRLAMKSLKKVLEKAGSKLKVEDGTDWEAFLDSLGKEHEEAAEERAMWRAREAKARHDVRPLLGVQGRLDGNSGATVLAVEPGRGAEAAGVRAGDVITTIDGWPVKTWNDLVHAVRHCQPGDKVPIKVKRNGKTVEMEALITEAPEQLRP